MLLLALALGLLGLLVLDEEVAKESEQRDHVVEKDLGCELVVGAVGVGVVGRLDHHRQELGHLHASDEELVLEELNLEGASKVVRVHDDVNKRVESSRVVGWWNQKIFISLCKGDKVTLPSPPGAV